MSDRGRPLIMAMGAAVSATALVIGGLMAANALSVDDTSGKVTATSGVGTSTVSDVTPSPTATPTATPTQEPAPVVPPAEPVVQPAPIDVSDDPVEKEKHRDKRWDDGDAANDQWWCDEKGSWHWGDKDKSGTKDPTEAPAAPAAQDPATADPSTDHSSDHHWDGDQDGRGDGDRSGFDRDGRGWGSGDGDWGSRH